jgi:uncharacterized repeat protein (TIGR03803 family)
MPTKKPLLPSVAALTVALAFLATAHPLFAASKEKVLYSFGNAAEPEAGLIFDASGNLYGTTVNGGSDGQGTVFELTHGTDGRWKEKVLHNFGSQGCNPVANLLIDATGSLYGTTSGLNCDNGTIFQLVPGRNDSWTYNVLYSFTGSDGDQPDAGLISDAAGNLFGTTVGGGNGWGNVFELKRHANGKWTEKVLYSFDFNFKDGVFPEASLVFDPAGNLYGTTWGGGDTGLGCGGQGCGTVFELTPSANGTWKEKVLQSFSGEDGTNPSAPLIQGTNGNFYGTTSYGGVHLAGTVFELTPGTNGTWNEKVLHSFNGQDGEAIYGGLVSDADGNLYGMAAEGGLYGGGTAFELTSKARGEWTEKTLYSFLLKRKGGYEPRASLIFDGAGNLYGTTLFGGAYYSGTVFEITRP